MVLSGFDPEKDERDRRLLYEVTGLRLDNDDFRDQTSSEEEGAAEVQGYLELGLPYVDDLQEAEKEYALNRSKSLT